MDDKELDGRVSVGERWAKVAVEMLAALREDYAPGELKDTDGVRAIIALRQRAEQAERLLTEARNRIGDEKDATSQAHVRAEIAERKRDALRKDAERYRWFRASKNTVAAQEMFERCCEDHLDGEIDAALERK